MMAAPAPAPRLATIVHLSTGHVLAAVTAAGLEPSLEDVTGGTHLRVRLPATRTYVDVPNTVLHVARVAVTADVLDAPQRYVLGGGPVPLTIGTPPTVDGSQPSGVAGTKVVAVWQDGDESIPADGVVGPNGVLPGQAPAGATQLLLAIAGKPLHLRQLAP